MVFGLFVKVCLYSVVFKFSLNIDPRSIIKLYSRSRSDKTTELASPPGYSSSIGNNQIETARDADSARLIIKKSWDLALGPIKQVIESI